MTTQQRIERINGDINTYLALGGLFNPEMMNPDRVRDLIIDCRDTIAALTAFAEERENDLWAKDEWLEEDGFVLWWSFPITEPPYVGTPLCSDFPGHVTHWTRIKVPSTGEKPE